eukprot:TRINITY_DN7996_c0_g1_i4.p1 TRINITY_DN7996_c0_g1~~TRINITY_DN7996_c0_g1_i4.p1  ORF type:complete len:196 (+),score=63.67 TRINITY_DN7996_c0_g1_i4:166-753(+)
MVKYSREPAVPTKAAKARGDDMRIHYKNTYEVAAAIRGMQLEKAEKYLRDVIDHKQCVPFRKHSTTARTAQAHPFHVTQGRWPKKPCEHLLDLLENVRSNADAKGLDLRKTYITHIQVNKARKGRRRGFKAHGRIKDWCASNCHVELFVTEKAENVKKAEEEKAKHFSKKQLARMKLRVGKPAKKTDANTAVPGK